MLTWTQIESAAVAAGWKRAGVEWRGPCPFCGGRDRAHVRPGSSANFIGSCRGCGAAGAWAERGPAAFVEAAAGAEGQDALARSVDAFDLARKHDKAEALRVLSVEAWLWAGYLGLSRVDPDLGLAADTVRSVAHSGLTALRDRFARTPAGGRLSALTVVWRARTRPAITARRGPHPAPDHARTCERAARPGRAHCGSRLRSRRAWRYVAPALSRCATA